MLYDLIMAEFKYNLRNLRRNANKTGQEVADALGISNSLIYDWEKGVKAPSRENLEKLADYFGVTMDYLVGRKGATVHDFFSDEEIIKAQNGAAVLKDFTKLPPEQQKQVQDYIEFLIGKKLE